MNKGKKQFNKLVLGEKTLEWAYAAMVLLFVFFTVYSYSLSYDSDGFNRHGFVSLSRGWVQVLPDGSERDIPSLPVDLDDKLEEEIVIRRQLPGLYLVTSPTLFVHSNHQTVTVRLDGNEVYHYQFWASNRFDADFPPAQWLIIPLSAESHGAEIEISLTRLQDDGTDTVSDILLGDKADIIFELARRNLFPLLCSLIPLMMGTVFIVRQVLSPTRKELGNRNLYTGIILDLLAVWMIANSDIRQLFFTNIPYVRNMEFLSLAMLPVPVILSMNYAQRGKYKTTAYRLCALIFLLDFILMKRVLVNYNNMLSMLWLIMTTIAIAALFVIVSLVRIALTDPELFQSLHAMVFTYGILVVAGLAEFVDMMLLADRHKGICISIGVLGYAIGLTIEQSRTQRRLVTQVQRAEMASNAKSEFLASMSHEIRTPINAVLGMDEMILRESKDPVVLGYATDIQNAGKHLLTLINAILDLSRIEAGRMEIVESEYDLSALLTDITDMIRVSADEKNLKFDVRIHAVTPNKLRGDAARIRQVAINLLNNAVKYTQHGRIVFTVDSISEEEALMLREQAAVKGEQVELENPVFLRMVVRDTGVGIRKEDVDKIFDNFQRVDMELNAGIQGTGLGLPIVSTLVQMMNGALLVKSVYGVGSEFTVIIPQEELSNERLGAVASLRREQLHARKEQALFEAPEAEILAVDDNAMNRRLLEALLRRTKIQLTLCSSGKECLEKAGANRYDLILMDHLMPEMDGIETLHQLRKLPGGQNAETPVIVLTANAIVGAKEDYLAEGFTDYLSKPIQSGELERMLRRYLPEKKLRSAGESEQEAKPEAAPLPDWLYGTEEIDAAQGLKFCVTPDIYLETLEIYAKNAAALADELEALYRAGDAANTVVKVHALKSTSRAIGAEGIGALAERLEAAGKAGGLAALGDGMEELLFRFRALGEQLVPHFRAAAEKKTQPSISDERLRETYDRIGELLEEFEYDRAASMIESLGGFELPEGERERCEKLRHAAENFDWDQIGEILK